MGNQLVRSVRASDLANELHLVMKGDDHLLERVLPLNEATDRSLSFSRKIFIEARSDTAVVIAPPDSAVSTGSVIEADNPRLAFVKALAWLGRSVGFILSQEPPQIGLEAKISSTAIIGKGVKIGKGTVINHFVVIGDGVEIGENCVIKSGTIVGEDGFGFERDENGVPFRMPHLGSVVIMNNVEIGSLNTICRGALSNTIIEDDVKTDDHVHIAHNCHIGRGALLTACVELSGGVEIGEFAWIGPNSSVIQKLKIGDHAFVGIASNITKSVAPGDTVAGNPARVVGKKPV
jgi:UDP-3-O-[3-hydroxymyristoyl] glucosamine N-acyltransferase